MLGRLRDIVYLLIFGYTSTERRCRELELDLQTIFEKMNLLLAREAKRESRQAIARLAELESGVVTPATPSDRKAALRTRVFGHLRPPHSREVTENELSNSDSEGTG